MTGYASVAEQTPIGRIAVELRSVNSRFLDLSFRIPDSLRALEGPVREAISRQLRRGKVECRIALAPLAVGDSALTLDEAALRRLAHAVQVLRQQFPEATPPTAIELLRWPGILQSGAADSGGSDLADGTPVAAEDNARLTETVLSLLGHALAEMDASRGREGAQLSAAIAGQLSGMRSVMAELATLVPELVAGQQRRLEERLRDALSAVGPSVPLEATMDRVRQEVAALGLRADIAEELDRLGAHVDEADRVINEGGAMGKRLDFLAQEMNREANTVGSKAAALAQTRAAMALKLLIEQMREQVQNIE
jgi:uncharacterized protein (TIGR00255 family)